MAPLPDSSSLKSYFTNLLTRTPSPTPTTAAQQIKHLLSRATNPVNPGNGVTEPTNIPNKAVFALFGVIGVGFVVTGIWFFFWAKNGGFYFKQDDWDDYKSTVLRRKGPNGTTLSGATESTDLGGGSVVHGQSRWGRGKKGARRYKDFDEESSQVTSSVGGSTLDGSEMSELKHAARKSKRAAEKEKEKANKKKAKKDKAAAASETGTLVERADEEDEMDVGVADAMRAYRHEKPARVGGINRQPDGSSWDGSNSHDASTAASDLLSHREHTPTNTPTKSKKERKDTYTGGTGGIRKVVSTSQPTSTSATSGFWARSLGSGKKVDAEEMRIKAEAKKLQDKGRAAQRRDFSFQTGDDNSTVRSSEANERDARREERREERERRRASRSPTKKVPGSYVFEGSEMGSDLGSAVSGDTGTKAYHHPIPGLGSQAGSDYAEERRKKRNGGGGTPVGGYRRGRRGSLSD